jgi:hypothetical protein
MIPMITARMPRAIRDVLSDLNMTAFLFLGSLPGGPAVSGPAGSALDSIVIITDDK